MTNCRLCGRTLRDEKSIEDGIGPKCKKHAGDFKRCVVAINTASDFRKLHDERSYDWDGDYRSVFRFSDSPGLRQLKADLLDALSPGIGLNYEENRLSIRNSIMEAVARAEAYGGASLEIVAMLAVVGIEHVLQQGKETDNALALG